LGIDPVYWLSEVWTARFAVFITSLWLGVPFTMLILLSGLESLPISIYEAAQIDGTTPIQSFFLITIPLLKRTILVATIFQTISSLRLFDVPWIVTAGGPGISNLTMSILAYKESMMLFRMGSGASQAMIILIITFIFAAGYINMMKEDIDF
jgi:ABC-type sugar transport system permease subunit